MEKKLKTVFVTGATGLLGNNLVRQLVEQGYYVKALARSMSKAEQQFVDLLTASDPFLEIIVGDMMRVEDFAPHLGGCEVLFHTAAYFKERYKGGSHENALQQTNVYGTKALLHAAYEQGVRRFIHTSSIAVLTGGKGSLINEECSRDVTKDGADDYFRSKVESEEMVRSFIKKHPDMFATFILPGWMWGPGDRGPTAAGDFLMNVVQHKLPTCMKGSFSLVDARDVAQAHIACALLAPNQLITGERFLAAGEHITITHLVQKIGDITQVKVPKLVAPTALVYLLAAMFELYGKVTNKPVLISWAAVRLMQQENERTHFDSSKATEKLGIKFREMDETITDTFLWFKNNNLL